MSDIELGPGKRARAAYSFDEIAIVPSRRTRDLEEVSISWQIDAYKFELPFISAPMDSVVSPETAIAIGEAGGLGVLNLEGIGQDMKMRRNNYQIWQNFLKIKQLEKCKKFIQLLFNQP